MVQTWEQFNRGLEKDDFTHAFELQKQLKDDGITGPEMNLQVHTDDIYSKQFQFAEVAKNDYTIDQLNLLEAAEKNLNDNITNPKLLDTFIQTAHETAKNLKEKYGEGWNEPAIKEESEHKMLKVSEDE